MTMTEHAFPAPSHRQPEIDRVATETPPAGSAGKPRRWTRWLRDLTAALLLVAVCVIGAGAYFTQRFEIMSGSMEPTLEVGDTVWAVRMMEPPGRGDIVAFVNPTDPEGGDIVLKRVIALPGELVEAVDGVVLVNLGVLDESVWVDSPEYTENFAVIELGPDEYFVMGDNRDESFDSRQFGTVSLDDMQYKVWER